MYVLLPVDYKWYETSELMYVDDGSSMNKKNGLDEAYVSLHPSWLYDREPN